MGKTGTIALAGASGVRWEFDVYSANTPWADDIACVFFLSNWLGGLGIENHQSIYVAATVDLKNCLANHPMRECFDRYGHNSTSLYLVTNPLHRMGLEADLIESLDPPCNHPVSGYCAVTEGFH